MKKTILTAIMAFAALTVFAQSEYDALLFSENNYEGTARSVAMGNAFTALGGDLGGISINPAGSAVAGYSQFSFTPSLTFSTNVAQGVSPYSDGYLPYFADPTKSRMTRFTIPNIGMTVNWDTNRTSGLKNMTFGFVVNRANSWEEDVYAVGRNSTTSFMGAMAYDATDRYLWAEDLGSADAYDFLPTDVWDKIVGYQSGMIYPYGGDADGDFFIGSSELLLDDGSIPLGGPLDQTYGRHVTGNKYDYLFNIGANISDFVYLGANLGITTLAYDYSTYFKEVAVDPSDFENIFTDNQGNETSAYFKSMRHDYEYEATGTGVFAKFGVIVTPGMGLRFGAAIQTPVATTIEEEWQYAGQTNFTSPEFNGAAESPEGEFRYSFTAPFRANFGAAYTLGSLAVISADYELCDYGQMRFRTNGADRDYFEEVNQNIKNRFGISHMLRAGLEVKPVGGLAIRAGYNLTSFSEKFDLYEADFTTTYRHNVSFGLGYSSKGSFYIDAACRHNLQTAERFMTYNDYIYDDDYNVIEFAPELENRHSNWKFLITLGWRFQ